MRDHVGIKFDGVWVRLQEMFTCHYGSRRSNSTGLIRFVLYERVACIDS
jgi:hypothetical protein